MLSGCSVRPRFKTVHVGSAREALLELSNRSSNVAEFSANTDCRLTGSFGTFQFRSKLRYSDDNGWYVKITGPLGINLAIIESEGDKFHVDVPYKGTEVTIDGDEPIEIPEMEMAFPGLDFLTRFLLPVSLVDDLNEWKIVYERNSSPSTISLMQFSDEKVDSLILNLELTPLRLQSEELWQEGELQIKRNFRYNSERDNIPHILEISAANILLEVKFNSVELETVPISKPAA